MRRGRRLTSPRVLVWLGVFGAPFAWTIQHVGGFALRQAQCSPANTRWGIAADGLTIAFTAVAVAIGLAGLAAAIVAYRETRGAGEELPGSRLHFLSIIGFTVTPLFLMIIVMSGLGSLLLPGCRQS